MGALHESLWILTIEEKVFQCICVLCTKCTHTQSFDMMNIHILSGRTKPSNMCHDSWIISDNSNNSDNNNNSWRKRELLYSYIERYVEWRTTATTQQNKCKRKARNKCKRSDLYSILFVYVSCTQVRNSTAQKQFNLLRFKCAKWI